MKIYTLLSFIVLLSYTTISAQYTDKDLDIDLWKNGLPNTNGVDHLPYDESKSNYKPSIRVFLPSKENATGRAVVACPGGAYINLAYGHEGNEWASFFNKQGIALIVLKYRMPYGFKEVPMSDAEEALRVVKENAKEWNINPSDIGIMGSSAGGHLASTIATHIKSELRPAFQILFYPVISMESSLTHDYSRYNFLGENPSQDMIDLYSNEKQVSSNTPRAFIVFCDDDDVVPSENGVQYYLALKKNKIPASLFIYPAGGHGWGSQQNFKYHNEVTQNLTAWLQSFETEKGFSNVVTNDIIVTASQDGNWGEIKENLKDNNQKTKYTCWSNQSDIYVQYELTAPIIAYKYSITNADYQPRDPKAWKLLGSADGKKWTELDAQSNVAFSGKQNTNQYVLRENETAYKFYRLTFSEVVDKTSDQLSFADWNLFVENNSNFAPKSVNLKGSALSESNNSISMGWKGGYYELYTSLKSGNYTFEGDNKLSGGNFTVLNGEEKPYRIRVDYRKSPTVVSIDKIDKIDIWTPWGQFVVAEMQYTGNSVFEAKNLLYDKTDWGDPRYRIRVFFENGTLETYGGRIPSSSYLTLTHNGQWGETNGLQEWNFDLAAKYRDTKKPFNITLFFDPATTYQNMMSDYIPSGISEYSTPQDATVYPTVVNDSLNVTLPKAGFNIEIISSSGHTVLSDSTKSETLTISNINIPEGVYLIKMIQNGLLVSVKRIIKS